jgi:DNA-binding protein YbaB
MALMISTSANYHWVKAISASTHGDGALKLTFHGDRGANSCQFNEAEVTVFTDDVELTARLIAAINGAAKPIETEQSEAA